MCVEGQIYLAFSAVACRSNSIAAELPPSSAIFSRRLISRRTQVGALHQAVSMLIQAVSVLVFAFMLFARLFRAFYLPLSPITLAR